MYHGIINVYKEAGYTSHDVVAKLRGICKQKKIGHTGTLDPDAVGVLPVCLGNGTKLCDMLTDKTKEYIAVFRLGISTDTQDFSGKILQERQVCVSAKEVKAAIAAFEGSSMQTPPMYSALKVNGRKLYELAREGKEIERAARPIFVSSIELLEEMHPDYTVKINCSKGTYIRTICHDIGQALGCGAVMMSLQRTRVGEFKIENSFKLEQIEIMAHQERLAQIITPVDAVFENYAKLTVKTSGYKALENGNFLRPKDCIWDAGEAVDFRVYNEKNIFYGIYTYDREKDVFCPVKLFMPDKEI